MQIKFHPHAIERMVERSAAENEVKAAVRNGEKFPAKFGRTGFRRNFVFNKEWRGKYYKTKQVEVFAVKEDPGWLVISVITRFF